MTRKPNWYAIEALVPDDFLVIFLLPGDTQRVGQIGRRQIARAPRHVVSRLGQGRGSEVEVDDAQRAGPRERCQERAYVLTRGEVGSGRKCAKSPLPPRNSWMMRAARNAAGDVLGHGVGERSVTERAA